CFLMRHLLWIKIDLIQPGIPCALHIREKIIPDHDAMRWKSIALFEGIVKYSFIGFEKTALVEVDNLAEIFFKSGCAYLYMLCFSKTVGNDMQLVFVDKVCKH